MQRWLSGGRRGSRWGGAAILLSLCLWLPQTALADPHWFSRSQRVGASGGGGEASPAAVGGPRDFDLTISLHNLPAGDDDGSTQGADPGSAAQDAIEEIVGHFADAVHAATEGCHRIRRVRIFRDGARTATADVVWGARGQPVSYLNGFGQAGLHLYMFDVFAGGAGGAADFDLLANPRAAGYVLAREWFHYALGACDEYVLRTFPLLDRAVSPSVMANPWPAALQNDLRALEFSIPEQGGGAFQDTRATRQHLRTYGLSVWDMLVSQVTVFEQLGRLLPRAGFPELLSVAPERGATPAVNDLDPESARARLDITWMRDEDVYTLVIDRSASMAGVPLENARAAANMLIDLAPLGRSRIGIVSFAGFASTESPLAPINTQADKDALKALVNGLQAGGGSTGLEAGVRDALDLLSAPEVGASNRACFLLSDGESSGALFQVPPFQARQIPIMAFAYGAEADTASLGEAATDTGGRLFICPTTLSALSEAFHEANLLAGGHARLLSGAVTAGPAGPAVRTFQVDSGLSRLDVRVTWPGPRDAVELTLTAPDGSRVNPTTISEAGGETLQLYSVYSLPEVSWVGAWTLAAQGAGAEIEVQTGITGAPTGPALALDVFAGFGQEVVYPDPMVIHAALGRALPIRDANLGARVTAPDGQVSTVRFFDDSGEGMDAFGGDGLAAGELLYRQDGTYLVEVMAEADGSQVESLWFFPGGTPTTQGTPADRGPFPQGSLGPERYQRMGILRFQVSGVQDDDHGDSPAAATELEEGAPVTRGRLHTGDVDWFTVSLPQQYLSGELVVRLGAVSDNAQLALTVLAPDQSTVLGRIENFETGRRNALGYDAVFLSSTSGLSSPLFIRVDLVGAGPSPVSYALSVGAPDGPDNDFFDARGETPAEREQRLRAEDERQRTECFIFKAAMGSPMELKLASLRRFRDERLLTNAPGRAFVWAYYQLSPPLARWIAPSEARRQAARAALTPAVAAVEHPRLALVVAGVGLGLGGLRARRRRRG